VLFDDKSPGKTRSIVSGLIVAGLLVGLRGAVARADGGAVRYSDRLGGCRVTVFTSPTPLRAGPVDVSVFVQDVETGEPIVDAEVIVVAKLQNQPAETLRALLATAAATNKLLQAANFEIPQSGSWELTVKIVSPRAVEQAQLVVEVGKPLAHQWAWYPWLCWPLVPIVLFALHRVLVFRRKSNLVSARTRQLPNHGTRIQTRAG
jgi:hypothetical protein